MPVFRIEEVFLLVLATMSAIYALLIPFISRLNRWGKCYLSAEFFTMSAGLIVYLFLLNADSGNLSIRYLNSALNILSSCLFYAFVRSVLFQKDHIHKHPLLWIPPFLPAILALILFLYQGQEPQGLITIVSSPWVHIGERLFSILLYVMCVRDVYLYTQLSKDSLSNLSNHQHTWVLNIIWVQIFYVIFPLSWKWITPWFGVGHDSLASYMAAGSIVFVYLLALIVITLLYSSKTLSISLDDRASLDEQTPANDPKPNEGAQEELEHTYQDVLELFENERIYIHSDLRVGTVADRLGMPPRNISYVINTCGKKNFYELVNEFRISAAKEILEANDDSQLTMQEVMFDVGYSSKSSFNKEFKKNTGLTPLQYRKKMSANT